MLVAKLKEEKVSEAYETLYGCSIPREHQCPFCEITWKSNHGHEHCPLLELEAEFFLANWCDEGFINL